MGQRHLAEQLNPNFGYFYTIDKSLYTGTTSFQECEVVETPEFGKVMLLDGVTQVAEKNEFLYHEPMVHPAMTTHPKPKSVCVIGAGDGGIVREVVKHGCERVVHAELDGGVVDACKEHMPGISDGCWDRPEVELKIGDGRKFIEETDEKFDVVIMDMTDPFGPSTMLYTKEYYQAVKNSLRDENGLYVMHCESPISRPKAYQQILRTLGEVWQEQKVFYLYIQMYAVLWSIVVSGDSDAVAAIDEAAIAQRLSERGIQGLQVYTPQTHHSMLAEFPFITSIRDEAANVPVVTDANPRFIDEIDLNSGQDSIQIPIRS